MVKTKICGTHAPLPHDEYICHATGERRQNIINEIKILLDKVDDRPCVLPDIRPNNKSRPIINYPGYVDKRHPAFQPPERPLITFAGISEIRTTSDPRVADNRADVCYKGMHLQKKYDDMPSANPDKAVELRAGVMYNRCECIKRNGLQDQCPRFDCQGRPECVAISPGPCCAPAMAAYNQATKTVFQMKEKPELCSGNKGVAICCCCHPH